MYEAVSLESNTIFSSHCHGLWQKEEDQMSLREERQRLPTSVFVLLT